MTIRQAIERFPTMFLPHLCPQLICKALSRETKAFSDIASTVLHVGKGWDGNVCVCVSLHVLGKGQIRSFPNIRQQVSVWQGLLSVQAALILRTQRGGDDATWAPAPAPHADPALLLGQAPSHHISQEHLCLLWTRSTQKNLHTRWARGEKTAGVQSISF